MWLFFLSWHFKFFCNFKMDFLNLGCTMEFFLHFMVMCYPLFAWKSYILKCVLKHFYDLKYLTSATHFSPLSNFSYGGNENISIVTTYQCWRQYMNKLSETNVWVSIYLKYMIYFYITKLYRVVLWALKEPKYLLSWIIWAFKMHKLDCKTPIFWLS